MLGTLTSFEQRLSNLESTVLPLYEHTGMLQQRQQSKIFDFILYDQFNFGFISDIAKTMKTLDSMLSFYRVAVEVDATVRDSE